MLKQQSLPDAVSILGAVVYLYTLPGAGKPAYAVHRPFIPEKLDKNHSSCLQRLQSYPDPSMTRRLLTDFFIEATFCFYTS